MYFNLKLNNKHSEYLYNVLLHLCCNRGFGGFGARGMRGFGLKGAAEKAAEASSRKRGG